jgi:hypothetical protein
VKINTIQYNTMKRMLGGGNILVGVVPHSFYYNKFHISGFILLLCGMKIWVRHSPNTFEPSKLQLGVQGGKTPTIQTLDGIRLPHGKS